MADDIKSDDVLKDETQETLKLKAELKKELTDIYKDVQDRVKNGYNFDDGKRYYDAPEAFGEAAYKHLNKKFPDIEFNKKEITDQAQAAFKDAKSNEMGFLDKLINSVKEKFGMEVDPKFKSQPKEILGKFTERVVNAQQQGQSQGITK